MLSAWTVEQRKDPYQGAEVRLTHNYDNLLTRVISDVLDYICVHVGYIRKYHTRLAVCACVCVRACLRLLFAGTCVCYVLV